MNKIKHIFRRAVHIVSAAVVLISTLGITINMHYCHDQLIDLALYSPAESCCDITHETSCDSQEGLSQMNHCEDDSIVMEALKDFMGSSLALDFDNNRSTDLLFHFAFLYSSPLVIEDLKSNPPDYYLPPPYMEVDLSRIQTYLI